MRDDDLVRVTVMAVLLAAGLHAGWNALAKAQEDRLGLLARSCLISVGLAIAGFFVFEVPAAAAWPWLIASIIIHVFYNAGLLYAYRVGDFNQTYPLARGVGPVVVAIFAALVLQENLSLPAAAGVVLIAASIGVLGFTPWDRIRTHRAAVIAAVFTGLTIAAYTIVDGVGVRRSGSAGGYTMWLLGVQGAITASALLFFRRRRTHASWGSATAVAAMTAAAYGLVLWAQTRGALAEIAALRESSVVVAAVIGMLFFKEPMGRVRIGASVGVAAGVVLLALQV
jgi:drug/metabolite transporter (DMT)-like permease